MPSNQTLDEIRREALNRVDRSERSQRWWIAVAAAIEAACLLTFISLADFSNRLHLLLFIGAILVYGTLAMGILALGAFTQSWCVRILAALQLLDERNGPTAFRGADGD